MGVASSFQAYDPYPMYLTRGQGSRVWDVDGIERIDFHGGFGCMTVGHAHPKIAEALEWAGRNGTQFAVTTDLTVRYAEELCRRFQMERVRFVNSGTEATMDAIRVARAHTGREIVAKIEGSYHGHHDTVLFSVVPGTDVLGQLPSSVPVSTGIPKAMSALTVVTPFNDLDHTAELFEAHEGRIACLIMEPVMMNIGIAMPEPGYLQAVKDLCERHGVVLIFDEVKTGATIAAGGATERFGVRPHLSCWAKAIAGGVPTACFGGDAEIMDAIVHGAAQQGTYNGNPLAAACGVAALTEILTPQAYEHLAEIGARLASGCQAAIDRYGIPAHTVDLGGKGCVSWRREPLRNYRDFLDTNDALYEASYPWMLNRGVFMTPGNEEQWTLSVQHTEQDIDKYVWAFTELCEELAG
jgi:glutamate-1-semialdehyde 2,1-aminomutase